MRDCSRWQASRRRHKFRTIRNALDKGIYGIVILKSEDEGIELDYPDSRLDEDFGDCIETLSKIQSGVDDMASVNRYYLEVARFTESQDINVLECLEKVELYKQQMATDEECDRILGELREIEDFVARNIDGHRKTI